MSRPLLVLVLAVPVLGLVYALASWRLVPWDVRPGAPVGQILGVIAGVLMLAALAYLPAKRSDVTTTPNRRLVIVHVVLGVIGAAIALAHSRLVWDQPPIFVLLAFLGLYGTGVYGRLIASRQVGPTFGRGGKPFQPAPGPPPVLREFIERKRQALAELDPAAPEGTFALSLGHWKRQPARALRYYTLTLQERREMRALEASGYAERMGFAERFWRVTHLLLAWAAVIGLLAHVTTTLFFADFAAGGREIYWWYIRK